MEKIAIVFGSKGGQTKKISEYMAERARAYGHSVQLIDAREPEALRPGTTLVILGSPVYRGKFLKPVTAWARAHREFLSHATSGLFTVSLNAADRHAAARENDARLLREFMERCGWVPNYAASIAGALNYLDYNWLLRRIMRSISAKAGGDVDMNANYEYTDWRHLDGFLDAMIAGQSFGKFRTEAIAPVRPRELGA